MSRKVEVMMVMKMVANCQRQHCSLSALDIVILLKMWF